MNNNGDIGEGAFIIYEKLFPVIATVLFIGIMGVSVRAYNHQIDQIKIGILQSGTDSRLAGVPAEANPFKKGTGEAYYWLEGWKAIEEKDNQ